VCFHHISRIPLQGNMFSAKCSYVSKLLSLSKFQQKTNELWKYEKQMRLEGTYENELFEWAPNTVGFDRYASEHWLGSHPDLTPCDVSPTIQLKHWQEDDNHSYDREFSWSLAPMRPISDSWDWHNYCMQTFNATVALSNESRFRQYFLLRGLIYRWITLFGTIAHPESWAWKWFPDGPRWLQAVEKFGINVLNMMIYVDVHMDNNDEYLQSLGVLKN
jgi:hypothetical protein